MAKFNPGDKVKYVSDYWGDTESNPKWGGKHGKVEGVITRSGGDGSWYVQWNNGTNNGGYKDSHLELINSKTTIMSSVKKLYKNLFVKEPQKSLREAGITDEDDIITVEGRDVYLTYLLEKDTAFHTEIVKPMVERLKVEGKLTL